MQKKVRKKQVIETDFNEILSIIEKAKENAFRAVNHELISMYWERAWGKSIVSEFADFVQKKYLGIKGFSVKNSRHW